MYINTFNWGVDNVKIRQKKLIAFFLVFVFVGLMLPLSVIANPASPISDDYVKVFTTQGKPIWIKLSLPSGALSTSLTPGSSVSFRLDYCFDGASALKPVAGDSLQLWVSGFPDGTVLLPSNMHTTGNTYRSGVITLNFADVGGYHLIDGLSGWMTVTFMASGNQTPGEYSPQIVGNGSVSNIILVEKIKIIEPGTDPGPSGPPVAAYSFIAKYAEHVLYPDDKDGYIMELYQYDVPIAPAYISYELVVQDGGGEVWENSRVEDFDYITITDTLGPGQEFAMEGEPDPRREFGTEPQSYGGTAPVYNITIFKHTLSGGVDSVEVYSIDKTDPGVQITVSADRKTFTLKIAKDTHLNYGDNPSSELFDEYCGIRLDYYAKVTNDEEITFYNNAKIEYVKNQEVTSGASGVEINVIKQAGADFIKKEVAKWSGVGSIDSWIDYWVAEDKGLHGANDPLIVNVDDFLVYYIYYTNTGDEPKPIGYTVYDELPTELELVQLRTDSVNPYGHDLNGFKFDYDLPTHKITLTSTRVIDIDETGWVSFVVRVKDTAEPGQPIFNSVGTNTTVVKTDGYAIQVVKCDADDNETYLNGAEFKLYVFESGDYTPYKELGSDVVLVTSFDGKTEVKNLPVGKYKLVETKTPDSYTLALNSLEVEFEILPESAGFKGINKIAILSAPGNMPDPIDNNGTAVFRIPNDKEDIPKGNILIFKEVLGENDEPGEYKVTLTAGVGNYLQFDSTGEYTGTGAAEFLISLSETLPVSLRNIPIDLGPITVTEKPSFGYSAAYSIGGAAGSVVLFTQNKQTVFVTVTNTPSEAEPSGTLILEKTVIGDGADPEEEFTFIVTFDGDDPGELDEIMCGGARFGETGTVALKADETATFTNIPLNTTYTISEDAIPAYYYSNFSSNTTRGSVDYAGSIVVTFVNTYDKPLIGNLTVKKIASPTSLGPFSFELTDARGQTVTTDAYGNPITISLSDSDTITIALPQGEYTITELDAAVYSTTHKIDEGGFVGGASATVTIAPEDPDHVVTFYNEQNTATLHLQKLVTNGEDPDQEFKFTVTFDDGDGDIEIAINSDVPSLFEFGTIVSLKNGDVAHFTEILAGTECTISELSGIDNYELNKVTMDDVEVSSIEDFSLVDHHVAVFTNNYHPDRGSLTVSKKTDDSSDSRVFTFTLIDPDSKPVDLSLYDLDGSYSLVSNGRAGKFRLSNDQSIIIYDLLAGEPYTIIEDEATGTQGKPYTTTYTVDGGPQSETGLSAEVIVIDESESVQAEVVFTNKAPVVTGSLRLNKTAPTGDTTVFKFTVSFSDCDTNGITSDDPGWNNDGTVNLRGGDSIIFNNIPMNARYTITENTPQEYVPHAPWTGVISRMDTTEINVRNTYLPVFADITGTKVLTGGSAPLQSFSFTLTRLNSNNATDIMTDAHGVPLPTETRTRIGPGEFTFQLEYLTAGTYYYKIQETVGGGTGWKNDTAARIVTVTVANGTYSIEWTVGSQTFTNEYSSTQNTPVYDGSEPEPRPEPTPEPEPEPEGEDEQKEELLEEEILKEEESEEDTIQEGGEPGGRIRDLRPNPTATGNSVELSDDGIYVEFDANNVPLGEWVWDDDAGEWVFFEYPPPLANMPATGDYSYLVFILFAFGVSLLCVGLPIRYRQRAKK